MAQHRPEQKRSFALAVHHDLSALSKIDLRLGSRFYFHPHKGHRLRLSPPPHEALYGIVTAGKLMFAHKVLVKTLGRQARMTALLNELSPGFTLAAGMW